MRRIRRIAQALAVLAGLAVVGLLAACGSESVNFGPTPTPRLATEQEIELLLNTITTTAQLKTVHYTFETMQAGKPVTLESDLDLAGDASYTRIEVGEKQKEKLTLQGVTYQKDPAGQWVEFSGLDEDLHGIQVIMSMMGNPVADLDEQDRVTNTQTRETMHGVQVEHFTWRSGSVKYDIWVDPKTGYGHKLTMCGTGQEAPGELCWIWTYSKQNEPVTMPSVQ